MEDYKSSAYTETVGDLVCIIRESDYVAQNSSDPEARLKAEQRVMKAGYALAVYCAALMSYPHLEKAERESPEGWSEVVHGSHDCIERAIMSEERARVLFG